MKDSSKTGIAKIVQRIRLEQGLTISEVSRKTGISRETIRRIEKGQFEPRFQTIEVLSCFFRINIIEVYSCMLRSTSDCFYLKIIEWLKNCDYLSLNNFSRQFLHNEHNTYHSQNAIDNIYNVLNIIIKFTEAISTNDDSKTLKLHKEICNLMSFEKLPSLNRLLTMEEIILLSIMMKSSIHINHFIRYESVTIVILAKYLKITMKDKALINCEKLLQFALIQGFCKFEIYEKAIFLIDEIVNKNTNELSVSELKYFVDLKKAIRNVI